MKLKFPLFSKRKSFPFIEQTGMMECGTTSLAMIFKHYGFYNVQRVLAQMAQVDTEGTNLFTLIEIAELFGFETEAYELEYKYLMEIKLPCIAHFDGYHFIVVYKADENHVWVADPAYGKDKYTRKEFLERWNGVALVIEPTEAIFKNKDMLELLEKKKEENASLYRKYYRPVFKSRKKLILQILLATFFLQLTGLSVPIFTQAIVDQVLVYENKRLLFSILLGMGAIFSVQIVFLYIRNILLVQFKVFVEYDFFSKFFIHFISLFQGYYDRHKREDFINRFRENIKIRQMANPAVLQAVVDLFFILGYIPLLWFYNVTLGLIATILTIMFLGVALILTPKIRRLANKVFYKDVEVLGKFLDVLLGIRTIKLLGIERIKFMGWRNEYKRNLNAVVESEKVGIGLITIQRAMYYFSQITIFWIGAYLVFIEELSLGQYLAFITIFMIVLNALSNISFLWIDMTSLSVSVARLNDVLVQESEYENNTEEKGFISAIGSIEIKDLSFKYRENDDHFILQNFNLKIKAGQKIGIVGRNGAGKTTLVKLLVHLYPQFLGQITFNGSIDIKSVNVRALRRQIFMFPQDIYLFDTTIRENILYANPSATDDEIIIASTKADLHEFVKTLHLGYNHKIGELGGNLSGGQKLKIGFARLFVSRPDVIILDEASSALDLETERKILSNILETFGDKIIISVAHRLITLKNSDQIIVIDEGKILESGRHEELMKLKGLYHKFMNTYVEY